MHLNNNIFRKIKGKMNKKKDFNGEEEKRVVQTFFFYWCCDVLALSD